MATKGKYALILVAGALFVLFAATSSLSAREFARRPIEVQHTCLDFQQNAPPAIAVHYGYYPHYSYYHRYPYYRSGYRYHSFYRRHFRYYGMYPYYYGYHHLYLPRYYFYPKFNHDSKYYYPRNYSTAAPYGLFPSVGFVIGDRALPGNRASGQAQYIIRIVSRLEPVEEINRKITLGKVMLATGDYEAAAKQFLDAMALSPSSTEARLLYARASAATGRYGAAAFALRRACARDADILENCKVLNESGSDLTETLSALQAHIRSGPDDVSALFVYGFLCAASGRQGEAHAVFARLSKMDPDCREAATMAELLEGSGGAVPKNT